MYGTVTGREGLNLQATLSASSAINQPAGPTPHHPITCNGNLRLEEDGSFACEHAEVGPDDIRTRFCVDHSIALLLIEEAQKL